MKDNETLLAILRTDLVAFTQRCFAELNPSQPFNVLWQFEHFAYLAQQLREGGLRRLLVAMPPRSLKSTFWSVVFPAWSMGHDPSLRIVCASYSQELAGKFSQDFRRIVDCDWYGELFPGLQVAEASEFRVRTSTNGERMSTSVNGSMTGMGGSYLILDDVIKAQEAQSETARKNVLEWLQTTAFSRLDDKSTGRIVIVGQRLHLQDPIGEMIAAGGWHNLSLPAIAEDQCTYALARQTGVVRHVRKVGDLLDPHREPLSVLHQVKKEMGAAQFNAQYQQRPELTGDTLMKWEWVKEYDADSAPDFDFVFVSVDPALASNATANWTAILVFGVRGKDFYLTKVERRRVGYVALLERLVQLAESTEADAILIESAAMGVQLAQDLESKHKGKHMAARVFPLVPKGSKELRMLQVLPRLEQGHLHVPRGASWLPAFRDEVCAFPYGRHDDQVDALSQFVRYFWELVRRTQLSPVYDFPKAFAYNCYRGVATPL